MPELWDLYSSKRELVSSGHVRGEPLPEGCFHLVAHVWLRNAQGEFLISQRAESRPTFPLMWETTGGSVLQGETSLRGALREVREELGIPLQEESGRLVFSQVRDWVNGARFGDLLDVWLFDYNGEPRLSAADGEVAQARWMSPREIEGLYREGKLVDTLGYFFDRIAGEASLG